MRDPRVLTGRVLASSLALLTATIQAQSPIGTRPDPYTGYGCRFIDVIDVTAATGSGPFEGVTAIGERLFATASNGAAFALDHRGQVTESFSRPLPVSVHAFYDGATDGRALLIATDAGVIAFETDGRPARSILAARGPQSIPSLIAHPEWVSACRGLAYDPDGNGGFGSLWLGRDDGTLHEVALDGTPLRSIRISSGGAICGLALDDNGGSHKSIWVHGGVAPETLTEYRLTGAEPTGNTISCAPIGGRPGGLSGYRGPNGYFGLIAMQCGSPGDQVIGYRVDVCAMLPGEETHVLVTSAGGSNHLDATSPKGFGGPTSGQNQLYFAFKDGTREPGGALPGCLIVNPSPWVFNDGVTPGLLEFAGLHLGSTPVGYAWMVPIMISESPELVIAPPPPYGNALRIQAVYPDPRAPFGVAVTNQAKWVRQ